MASATVTNVDVSDTTQTYTIEIRRTNGSLLTTGALELQIQLDQTDVRDQIKRWANDQIEAARPKAQRRLLQPGAVIDLG